MDVLSRMVSVGTVHHALPLTGLMCMAAACVLPDTIPFEASTVRGSGWVRVGLSRGVVSAKVDLNRGTVRSVSVLRTARRLMAGKIYLRARPPILFVLLRRTCGRPPSITRIIRDDHKANPQPVGNARQASCARVGRICAVA